MTACANIPVRRDWGRRLKERRALLKISQRHLAQVVNVTQTTISRIERGIETPRLELMCEISKTLRCEVADLFPYPEIDWSTT